MPYNFVADSFHTQKNFEADFLQAKCDLRGNRPFCVFETPCGTYGQCTTIILGSLERAYGLPISVRPN